MEHLAESMLMRVRASTHTHTLPCGNLSSGGGVLDDGADGDEGRRCENDNGAKEGNNNGRA